MRRAILSVLICGAFLLSPLAGLSQSESAAAKRGRYLVNQVAQCGDCHTPHVAGVPDKSKWLKGSVLEFRPLAPVPGWASAAPDLTSTSFLWKSWGDKAMVDFFMTGHGPDGKAAAPPMPAFTLTGQDARAMVAYLKSLP